ncbi:hypothetical protein MN116_004366 [Schistosoma mekongi]|uniref:5'-AMP-activated protein kinase subunit beta-1 n=1 Tax=Schistosoma mekongi TaxID=38744 RepID=A0AAE2D6N9_SCHME|nr:hypothetical protein MN116_004366 [Schistosoma mekongi]
MGNTPAHYKRRLSGDANCRLPSCTPGVSVTIPPPKRRNTHSLTDLSHSAPADYTNNEMSVNDDMNLDDQDELSIDEATSMMRAASLREPINIDVHNDDDNNRLYNLLQPEKMITSTSSSGDENITNFIQERPCSAGPLCCADDKTIYHRNQLPVTDNISRDCARTLPTKKAAELKLPTVFRWNGGGKDVYISGTFNNWEKRIPMVKRSSGVYVIINCKPGTHQYKYFIDGAWYHDPTKPTVDNEYGTKNNVVQVKQSDFDVLHALEQDQASSRRRSHSSESCDVDSLGHSPPGEYGRFMPANLNELQNRSPSLFSSRHASITPSVLSTPQPPLLPPHLLQGILNMDTNIHCDPNLLPQPNHVIVNHLYALSIKDGVIVLSVITRFRQKFVSTLFYRPIEG